MAMARVGAELRRQGFVSATVKVIAEHGNATTRRISEYTADALRTIFSYAGAHLYVLRP